MKHFTKLLNISPLRSEDRLQYFLYICGVATYEILFFLVYISVTESHYFVTESPVQNELKELVLFQTCK